MTRKLGFLTLAIVFLGLSLATAQAVPDQIGYQGKLNDQNGVPIDGTVSFTFALYTQESGGVELWTETQSIQVSNGIFNVNLGASTTLDQAIFLEPALYLGIRAGADQEMTPRQKIVSGSFSRTSGTVESLLERTVWPKHYGRDSSIVSYYAEFTSTAVVAVIAVDRTLIITDIMCSTNNLSFAITLSYDSGAGAVTVFKRYGTGLYSAAQAHFSESFKSGIPIPPGASLSLLHANPAFWAYCTVSGFQIPEP